MLSFTALYPESTGGSELPFTLHRAGCAAAEREQRRRGGTLHTFEAPSIADALAVVVDDELVEMGYSVADVKRHACTRDANQPRGER